MGVGVRVEGGGGGKRRNSLYPKVPFAQARKKPKGKRAAGYVIYFHFNMEGKYHTPPSPFQGECILISSLFSIHLVYECVHTHHN